MIYVLLSYIFYPVLYLLTLLKKKKGLKRILVIQTAKIGDMICSSPVFREIKKTFPDVHLSVMATRVTKELLEHNPYIDDVIVIDINSFRGVAGKFRLCRLVYSGGYDAVVCLNPNVPFAIAALWGMVPVRLSVFPDFSGLTFRLASFFFTGLEKHVRGRLVAETYMRMLKALGIDSHDSAPEVYSPEAAEETVRRMLINSIPASSNPALPTLIGIAVSSGNRLKEIGTDVISAVTDAMISTRDAYVVLIGAGDVKAKTDIILNTVGNRERVIDTAGRLTLAELPALIGKLSLFIGVDTGITYMADALSVPLIDIAGPADMNDQRPRGAGSMIIQKQYPCVPCSHAFRAPYECRRGDRVCITSVSAGEIITAAGSLLQGDVRPGKKGLSAIEG